MKYSINTMLILIEASLRKIKDKSLAADVQFSQ